LNIKQPNDQFCECYQKPLSSNRVDQLAAFYNIREHCPALFEVTIPNEILEEHRRFSMTELDNANHCSIAFYAYLDGWLEDFTEPFHRYVLSGKCICSNVTQQYRKDFRENWFFKHTEIERFKSARRYKSRLSELNFCQWLEFHDWEIIDLEMYGSSFDVEAKKIDQKVTRFEVKYLDSPQEKFELSVPLFESGCNFICF
jgi:hypothetical protein